jgi:anti-sigma regulatory factor (Ser/Thr protein kinase)
MSGGATHKRRRIRSAESGAEAIRDLRRSARAFAIDAGASNEAVSEIEAAVGEALANVHVHAYSGEGGPVELMLEVEGAEFTCLVRDEGRALTDVAVPGTTPGGRDSWGLYLMRQLMDMVEISHPEGRTRGTVVRMRKRL